MDEITQAIKSVAKELFNTDVEPELTRPDEQFGDYATNVALQLANKLDAKPREIAQALADKLDGLEMLAAKPEVAGPGFLNFRLTDGYLLKQAFSGKVSQVFADKVVVAEYSDPNPFKVLHAGHLYTSVIGDAVANLFAAAGGNVHRVNYGGDVGLHVGKTMWSILQKLAGEHPHKLDKIAPQQRSEWMADAYVEGTKAYEDNEQAKQDITAMNKLVYKVHADNDHDSPFAQIYWQCRQWSYDYFDAFYERIGTKFEKYYPESEVVELGVKTVNQQLEKGVFKRSDGAVIFDGEKYGLHTRVFINSQGIPTYEAKDVGLIMTKFEEFHFDKSLIITGNEQEQYMAVVLKAIEQFMPELTKATSHLTHGIVKLQGGQKMSSRAGNILRAVDVLDAAAKASQVIGNKSDPAVELGAVKYAFLKQRTGGDIIYDPQESVALQGNSGPYLQYAHARARSIIAKSTLQGLTLQQDLTLQEGERGLARKISEYAEVVDKAVEELMPHHICTYLYELAQVFNRFYENNRVVGNEREAVRLQLVRAYADTLQNGLSILNIPAPEKM